MRLAPTILAALIAAFATTARAELPDLEGRTIAFGTAADYAPYAFLSEADNTPTGWDIDMVEEACRRLNADCTWGVLAWDLLLEAVRDRQYDAAVDGITITEERAQVVDFSLPYLRSVTRMLARGDETRFDSVEGFVAATDATVAVLPGTSQFYTALYTFFEGDETNPRMVQMDSYGAALLALQTGDVDVVLTDGVNAVIFEANSGGAIRPVGEEFAGEDFGIAFPKGSDLVAAFDAAIAEMRADGFLEGLDEKYLVAK
jgi:polar amino acid transport system substrate-binding protein